MTGCGVCSRETAADPVTTSCCSALACRPCAVSTLLKDGCCWSCSKTGLKISDLSPIPGESIMRTSSACFLNKYLRSLAPVSAVSIFLPPDSPVRGLQQQSLQGLQSLCCQVCHAEQEMLELWQHQSAHHQPCQ